MTWSPSTLASHLAETLRRHEESLCAEQAVHGIDSLAELALHPILAEGMAHAGYAVLRETPYPGQPEVLPAESQRQRCDMVIAPHGVTAIADSIRRRKELRSATGTLFEPMAAQIAPPSQGEPEPEEVFWLEVKTFGQFTYADGIAGPNRSYAAQFGICKSDIRKLARSRQIRDAGLAIVLFAAEERVADHDLTVFVHRCLDLDLPVTGLIQERLPILDRIGNRVCTVALIPVRPTGEAYTAAEIGASRSAGATPRR